MSISPIQKEINRNLLKTNTENKRAFNKENTVNKSDFGEFKLEKKQIEKLKDWQKKIFRNLDIKEYLLSACTDSNGFQPSKPKISYQISQDLLCTILNLNVSGCVPK